MKKRWKEVLVRSFLAMAVVCLGLVASLWAEKRLGYCGGGDYLALGVKAVAPLWRCTYSDSTFREE